MPFVHAEDAARLYKRLEQGTIRLIRLSPRTSGALSCELCETSLTSPVPYEALSYVWGDPTDTVGILVDGYAFAATKNLESGLRHLQFENDVRILWVDAVCINQLDEDEKSEQIPATADIYSQATYVCAWLGAGFSVYPMPYLGTAEILRYLLADEHIDDMKVSLGFCNEHDEIQDGEFVSRECAERIGTSNPLADALIEISSCPYWRRVWVTQEQAASGNVYFYLGSSILTLPEITGIIRWTNNHIFCCRKNAAMPKVDFSDMAGKLFQNRFACLSAAPESFVMTLHSAQGSEASIPKDRYFALQRFASPSSLSLPDYRLDNASIAKFVTRQHIAKSGQLIMLVLAVGRRISQWAVPSWAFDLEKCDSSTYLERLRLIFLEGWRSDIEDGCKPRFPRYNADNGQRAELVAQSSFVDKDDNLLSLKGVKLGKVVYVDTPFPEQIPDNEENLNIILQQAAGRLWRCNQHAGPRRTNSQEWDNLKKIAVNLGRLMTFDEIDESQYVGPVTPGFDHVEEMALRQQSMATWFEAAANGSLLPSHQKDKIRVMALNHRFCPFVLEDGKIGMFVGDVQVDDVVCILDGSGFPFLLRPVVDHAFSRRDLSEAVAYRLVGRAFVQEVMYGEATIDDMGRPVSREIFHLC